jgi:para-nitrobenzyl esterase
MSVCDHLVAPDSAGLFRAAIIASGPCQAQASLATAQRASTTYAESVGCADPAAAAACLRALPAGELAKAPTFVRIGEDRLSGPVTGTPVLPVDPVTAIQQGRAARVPVLIGTTRNEFTLFMALQYLRQSRLPASSDYPGMLADTFGPHAQVVGASYPLDRYRGDVALAYAAAVTDGFFSCLADRLADALAGGAPVYAYEFSDPGAPAPEPLRHVPFPVGAGHSLDLRYLFDIGGAPPLNPAQQRLSDQMIGYWTQFISTNVPGIAGEPAWPQLNGHRADGPRMSFEAGGARVSTDFERDHQCPFWAGLT